MLKGFDFAQPTETFTEAMKNPLNSWQQTTQKVMDAQADWMKIWTGAGKETKDE